MKFASENINDYRCENCLDPVDRRYLRLTVYLPRRKCPQCGSETILYNRKILKGLRNV